MSALEREIIEKFHQLHPDAKERVRALIEQEMQSTVKPADDLEFDYAAWFRDVEALREQIRGSHADSPIDIIGILRDIRDGEDE